MHALSVLIFTVCALVSIEIQISSFSHFSLIKTFLFLYQNTNHVHSCLQSRVNLFSLWNLLQQQHQSLLLCLNWCRVKKEKAQFIFVPGLDRTGLPVEWIINIARLCSEETNIKSGKTIHFANTTKPLSVSYNTCILFVTVPCTLYIYKTVFLYRLQYFMFFVQTVLPHVINSSFSTSWKM